MNRAPSHRSLGRGGSVGPAIGTTMGAAMALALGMAAAWAPAPALAAGPSASAESVVRLGPLVRGDAPVPLAPWALAKLPAQTLPVTRFNPVQGEAPDGAGPAEWMLRIEADGSYGNLLHPFTTPEARRDAASSTLSWWWRIEERNPGLDLTRKEGDDTEVKVCVLFDLPIARVPLGERLLLQLARSRTGEPLPAATVCYTSDPNLASGQAQDNAYSRRVRYLVLRGRGDDGAAWKRESRRLADDFRRLFGDESPDTPPVLAIAVGADADNAKARSRSLLTRLQLDAALLPLRP